MRRRRTLYSNLSLAPGRPRILLAGNRCQERERERRKANQVRLIDEQVGVMLQDEFLPHLARS